MSYRALTACFLLSSTIAAADGREITLAPTCAEIDVAKDQLSPEAREVALRLLVRALERAEQLVVDRGCSVHFTAWHERTGDRYVVRIRGPRGVRKARDKSLEQLGPTYERAIELLTEPESEPDVPAAADDAARVAPAPAGAVPMQDPVDSDAAATQATAEPERARGSVTGEVATAEQPGVDDVEEDNVASDEPNAVSPDRLIYGQLSVGTHGLGFGIGYRRQNGPIAFDLGLTKVGDAVAGHTAFAAELQYLSRPQHRVTAYYGGGLSFASQRDIMETGEGIRAEFTAGVAFARDSRVRWFAQADLALPFFEMSDAYGRTGHSPTLGLALGAGF
jgi:hypothetical protein